MDKIARNISRIVSVVLFRGQRFQSPPTRHHVTHYVFVDYHPWRCIPTRWSVFSLVHERSPRPFKISVEVDALQIMRYVIQHYYPRLKLS